MKQRKEDKRDDEIEWNGKSLGATREFWTLSLRTTCTKHNFNCALVVCTVNSSDSTLYLYSNIVASQSEMRDATEQAVVI